MKECIGAYCFLNEEYGYYKFHYLIKNITTGQTFIKLKKNIKKESIGDATVVGLESVLNNIISLMKIELINENSEIKFFSNNGLIYDILKKSNDDNELKNIEFFLRKIKKYEYKNFKGVKTFIFREKRPNSEIYTKCEKAGREYKRLLNRKSTLFKLEKELKLKKNIIFFDFEMNCLSDFKSIEIISVGACKMNIETLEKEDFYSVIKPKYISELTEKCIEITGLNQDEIDKGRDFNTVFKELETWATREDVVYIYWGGNDIRVLINDYLRNNGESKVAYNISRNNIDFQEIFCKDILKRDDMLSLTNALGELSLEFKGEAHNSFNDAYNLYRLFKKWKKSLS